MIKISIYVLQNEVTVLDKFSVYFYNSLNNLRCIVKGKKTNASFSPFHLHDHSNALAKLSYKLYWGYVGFTLSDSPSVDISFEIFLENL